MGMFDSLYITCKCGNQIEFQSKAGPCILKEYNQFDVDPAVAGDLNGTSEQCQKCGRYATIRTIVIVQFQME
jgi:hypothetical protein